MRLLVCTVTRRSPDVCRPNVDFALKTCPDCNFLLVNNGGDPRQFSPERFREDPRLSILHLPVNVGYPCGVNFAIQKAFAGDYEFFLVLDDDIMFVNSDWYAKCVELMAFDRRIGVIGPKVLRPDGQTVLWANLRMKLGGLVDHFGEPRDKEEFGRIQRVSSVNGCFFFLRVEHMRKVGYFDLLFSPSGQFVDTDYCFQMWRHGFSCVYDGRTEIIHRFLARYSQDDPMRRLHYNVILRVLELKYAPLAEFGLKLEDDIDKLGREIVLPV